MKRLFLRYKSGAARTACALAGFFLLLASCNKPFPDTRNKDFSDGKNQAGRQRKTLLIVVDGAVGAEVKAALPPTLNSLLDFSIYSWDALSGYRNAKVTNASGWATLLTGTTPAKHNVTGEDFTGSAVVSYPSLFTRLKTERPALRTVAFSASAALTDNLAADATKKETPGTDEAVKNAAVTELKTGNPDVLLAEFNSVDEAGKAVGYTATAAGYKAAILQVDAYIGEILKAMRGRGSFAAEDWLVLITSNKGSNTTYTPPTGVQWNAFNDVNHNTFFINYNPRILSQNLAKPSTIIPYIGTTPLYVDQANSRARVLNPQTNIDMGATSEYTMWCKIRVPTKTNYGYPAFFGKRESFDGGGGKVGWVFFLENNLWQVNMSQAGAGNRQAKGGVVADDQWHTLVAVVRKEGAARNVYVYTDGVEGASKFNIADWGDMSSGTPLTAGFIPGSRGTNPNNYRVTDMRLYNAALSASYIAANFCKTDVPQDDPYRANLLGFWPATSVTPDNTMPDLSGKNNPMTVDSYNPGSFSDISAAVCPSISETIYQTVPNSADVAFQIYQWLGIIAPPAWGLDGKSWIPAYSDVKG